MDRFYATTRDRKYLKGFTVLEMVIVLAVIGLIAAIVAPRMGLLDGTQLKSSARKLVGAIRITYASAVVNKTYYRIRFNLEEQTYTIEQKVGDEYAAATDPLLEPRVLPGNIYVKRVEVMDRVCEEWCEEFLYFTPGGYVEEAAIYLSIDGDDRVFSVFTRPMTGRAFIVMEEMSREEWEDSQGEL
jgi:type II secretion system protein H